MKASYYSIFALALFSESKAAMIKEQELPPPSITYFHRLSEQEGGERINSLIRRMLTADTQLHSIIPPCIEKTLTPAKGEHIATTVISPDGKSVAIGLRSGKICLYEKKEFVCIIDLATVLTKVEIPRICISPDNRYIAAAVGPTVLVADRENITTLRRLEGHTAKIIFLLFTNDSRWLITEGDDCGRIWDLQQSKEIMFPSTRFFSNEWSPNMWHNQTIVSEDGNWKLQDKLQYPLGGRLFTRRYSHNYIYAIRNFVDCDWGRSSCITPNGEWCIIQPNYGQLRVLNLKTNHFFALPEQNSNRTAGITSACQFAITSDSSEKVIFWDLSPLTNPDHQISPWILTLLIALSKYNDVLSAEQKAFYGEAFENITNSTIKGLVDDYFKQRIFVNRLMIALRVNPDLVSEHQIQLYEESLLKLSNQQMKKLALKHLWQAFPAQFFTPLPLDYHEEVLYLCKQWTQLSKQAGKKITEDLQNDDVAFFPREL